MQYFGPLGKINLLAGPNNSGKSNVLSFVANHLFQMTQKLATGQPYAMGGLDVPERLESAQFQFAVPMLNSDQAISELATVIWGSRPDPSPTTFFNRSSQL